MIEIGSWLDDSILWILFACQDIPPKTDAPRSPTQMEVLYRITYAEFARIKSEYLSLDETGRITFCEGCPKYVQTSRKPTSAVFIALFFYQAGFTSIIGKSNMYTDVVATVGVCGFLWHCLAPLASQLLLHPRQHKWKKGKQAETGFKVSSNFGGDELIHKRLE